MPQVPQYDWSKMMPEQRKSYQTHGAVKIIKPAKSKWKPTESQKAEYAEKKYQEGLGRSLRNRV